MRTVAALLCAAALCPAAVREIHLLERSDILGGKAMGVAGPYERIRATVAFTLDPELPANRIVADLGLAPRNSTGQVAFTADLDVIRPRNLALGNGAVLFEVVNRGNKTALGTFQFGAGGNDPREEADFGDRFLFERGYTLVWLGWQHDVPAAEGLLRALVPVAKGITGMVRAEFVPEQRTTQMPFAERNHIAYRMSSPAAGGKLTLRTTPTGAPRAIASSEYRVFPDHLEMASGFEPGVIYEFVYEAADPAISGLGMAGVRDLISFLKYGESPFLLGDMSRFIRRAIGYGVSQSGRFLRTFVYEGFNADEQGRRVFDAVWPHVAGAGRGSFNRRFAQPSRDGQPWVNYNWPTDLFPFTDGPSSDGGQSGSLLAVAEKQNAVPKMFHTNGSYEYWGRAASLITTTPDGNKDVWIPPTSRAYFLAGAQHGPGRFPPQRSGTQNLSNPNDFRWTMRALLLALDGWVRDGSAPPPSAYPRLDRGELVAWEQFTPARGRALPVHPRIPHRLDFSKGEPPVIGAPYPVYLPATDADGNEWAGIRLPWIQTPLGTYTGWNLRAADKGAPQAMVAFIGSFFPWTKSEIEQRYGNREQYRSRIRLAAESLANQRFVLYPDIERMVASALAEWDSLTSPGRVRN